MSNIYEIIETLDELRTAMPDEKIIELFEKKVLNIKNEKVSYYFAKDVKGADIKAHGQVIIDSKNLNYNYRFARDVKGADIKAHGQVIIDSKNLNYNIRFAKDVKGADIKAHQQVIIDSAIAGTDTIECKQVSSESNCYNKVKRLMNLLNQATDN